MHFRLSLTIRELSLLPPDREPLRLSVQKAHPLKVLLSPDPAHPSVKCDVEASFEPSTKNVAAFALLAEDRLPEGGPPKEEWPKDFPHLDTEGRITDRHIPPMWLLPEGLRTFIGQLSGEMHSAAQETLGVLRWRAGTLGPRQPFSSRGMRFSLDGETWHRMPTHTTGRIGESRALEIGEAAAGELQELLDSGEREPLGHVLLREAWSEQWSNPRSSFLLGMAALEIGIKHYIAACVPDAEWLALNAPSPPVVELLVKYLPTLETLAGRHFEAPDEETEKAIKVAVRVRNELAHQGADVPDERLSKTLVAVRNLLWQLDIALGRDWADRYVLDSLTDEPTAGYRRI